MVIIKTMDQNKLKNKLSKRLAKQLSKHGRLKSGSMVIIKAMNKGTLKGKISYQSDNYQSDIRIDLSNISNLNNE